MDEVLGCANVLLITQRGLWLALESRVAVNPAAGLQNQLIVNPKAKYRRVSNKSPPLNSCPKGISGDQIDPIAARSKFGRPNRHNSCAQHIFGIGPPQAEIFWKVEFIGGIS